MFNFGIKGYKYTRPYQVTVRVEIIHWLSTTKFRTEKIDLIMRSGACFAQDPTKCPWEFVL